MLICKVCKVKFDQDRIVGHCHECNRSICKWCFNPKCYIYFTDYYSKELCEYCHNKKYIRKNITIR